MSAIDVLAIAIWALVFTAWICFSYSVKFIFRDSGNQITWLLITVFGLMTIAVICSCSYEATKEVLISLMEKLYEFN